MKRWKIILLFAGIRRDALYSMNKSIVSCLRNSKKKKNKSSAQQIQAGLDIKDRKIHCMGKQSLVIMIL